MSATYDDPLWGGIKLDEMVLQELAASRPVVRLKGIMQAGASVYLFPYKQTVTRFAHSMGVMHVLACLGAGLEEQVAGLLHDAPHTAFSHTADVLFPSVDNSFHDSFHQKILGASEVPGILERHGISVQAALEPEHYPLLEQPLPNLCADRIDYALRDRHAEGQITTEEAHNFLDNLAVHEGAIAITSTSMALWFGYHFQEANRSSWTAPDEAGAYWALAAAMKRAYSLGLFNDNDLFSTDAEAMICLQSINDSETRAYLSLLEPGTHFLEVEADEPHFSVCMKNRVIDPHVLEPGWNRPLRLSKVSADYEHSLRSQRGVNSVCYNLWPRAISSDLQTILLGLESRPGQLA